MIIENLINDDDSKEKKFLAHYLLDKNNDIICKLFL